MASGTARVPPLPAPALVLAAIASTQVGSALARHLIDDVGAAGATFLRVALASLFLLVLLRPAVGAWSRRSWRASALLGLSMAAMNLCFYLSLRTVPLGVAVTAEFLGPLLLALVQTRTVRHGALALVAAAGVVLLGLDSTDGVALPGLGLALLAGLFWAGYILASAHVGQVLPGLDGLAVALGIAALAVAPFGLHGAAEVVRHPAWLAGAAAVALLSSVVPYGLELSALRRLPTRVFGILMSLAPAGGALAGFVILGQTLGRRELVAIALVSLASAATALDRGSGRAGPG